MSYKLNYSMISSLHHWFLSEAHRKEGLGTFKEAINLHNTHAGGEL